MTSSTGEKPPDLMDWLPLPGGTIESVAAGKWWDAVRAKGDIGRRAMELLGDDSGAVIRDAHGPTWYWLVSVGSADGWSLTRNVDVLGESAAEVYYVGIPPRNKIDGPGLHWCIPVRGGQYLTSPDKLRPALRAAVISVAGEAAL